MRRWIAVWYTLLTALAVGSLIFAVIVATSPELLPVEIRQQLEMVTTQIDVAGLLIITGLIVSLGAFFALWGWRAKDPSQSFYDSQMAESNRNVPVAGESSRADIGLSEGGPIADRPPVKQSLREVLLHIYQSEFEHQSAVEEFLDQGEWTNDPYAAAYISTSDEIDYPVLHRIFAWLYPVQAGQKRIRRTVREIESVADDRFSRYNAPAHQPSAFERLQTSIRKIRGGDRQ